MSTKKKAPAKPKGTKPKDEPKGKGKAAGRVGDAPQGEQPAGKPQGPSAGPAPPDQALEQAEKDAGLPPSQVKTPPPAGPGGNVAGMGTGGLATNLTPLAGTTNRFAMPPDEDDEPLSAGEQKDVEDEVAELLRDPDAVGGTPTDRGVAAFNRAKANVLARRAAKAAADEDAKKKPATLTKEEAAAKEGERAARAEAYRGLDFLANPQAYARDPNDVRDRGPAEPMPVDYRRIQDEEGRVRGATPVKV